MKRMTIGKRTFLGMGLLCLVCFALSSFSIIQVLRLQRLSRITAEQSLPCIINAAQAGIGLMENHIRLNRLVRAATAEQRAAIRDEIARSRTQNSAAFDRLETVSLSPAEKQQLAELKQKREDANQVRSRIIALAETNSVEANRLLDTSRAVFDAYVGAAESIVKTNELAAQARAQKMNQDIRAMVAWLVGVALLGIIGGLLLAFLIVRSTVQALKRIAQSLKEGANCVRAAADEVSASSQSLAEGASEQAASLQQTSASLEQMASMTQKNCDSAASANTFTQEARSTAEAGAGDMEAMNRAMQAIKTSSEDIAKIIKTIDEIAFQTNILALNAAVEAARAGEAGMGFSVVADEVRNLAKRSAGSAKESSQRIQTSVQHVSLGVDLSGKVTQRLSEIVTRVRRVDQLVGEVASASREQSQGIAQVNLAVSQIDTVTQTNAASAEESASASEELRAQAETLKEVVDDLLRLAGVELEAVAKQRGRPAKTNPVLQGKSTSSRLTRLVKMAAPDR